MKKKTFKPVTPPISKPFTPTMELRFLRQIHHVSTAPADPMQVIIGKQYPTQTVQKCYLQQKWTNGTDVIWRDIEIVDDKVAPAPTPMSTFNQVADKLKPSLKKKLIMESIAKNKEISDKVLVNKRKPKRMGRKF